MVRRKNPRKPGSTDLNPADEAQLINELFATRRQVGLLINFGREGVKFRRAVNQQ